MKDPMAVFVASVSVAATTLIGLLPLYGFVPSLGWSIAVFLLVIRISGRERSGVVELVRIVSSNVRPVTHIRLWTSATIRRLSTGASAAGLSLRFALEIIRGDVERMQNAAWGIEPAAEAVDWSGWLRPDEGRPVSPFMRTVGVPPIEPVATTTTTARGLMMTDWPETYVTTVPPSVSTQSATTSAESSFSAETFHDLFYDGLRMAPRSTTTATATPGKTGLGRQRVPSGERA